MKKAERAHKRVLPEIRVARLCSRPGLLMTTALQAVTAAAIIGAPFFAAPAHAQLAPNTTPTGGQVAAGAASISQSPAATNIAQSSQRAAINWQTFDVGGAHTVNFQQPNSSAVALNRVVGPNPSEIAGRINANGQVVIVNQAGLLFSKGAQINTAGLVVSAAGISNSNFMAGKMVFDQAPNPGAKIENRGTITIKDHGLAALVAPQVVNSGVIRANMGTVVLAGAQTHTLDLYGDGLVSINVTKQVETAPDGTKALVTNTGKISASGGTVVLTADAVDGVVQTLVNSSGSVSAGNRAGNGGRVLISGSGGDVVVEGHVGAAGAVGGTIQAIATKAVTVGSKATIDASGRNGGGTIAIGTTLARATGGPNVTGAATARTVTISPGARIAANATVTGNGGNVTLLSTHGTRMAGSLSAKGGPQGGGGGFVEVSAEKGFSLGGSIDVSAPYGALGTILLDPDALTVVNGKAGSVTLDTKLNKANTIDFGDGSGTDTVTNGQIEALTGSIVLRANNTIVVNNDAPIVLKNNASLTLQTLTSDITIGAAITASGTGSITIAAGETAASGGKIVLNADLKTNTATGSITLKADGGINLKSALVTTGTLDMSVITSGGVNQTSGGVLTAAKLQSASNIRGAVDLDQSNVIAAISGIDNSGGAFKLTTASALAVGGLKADTVALTAPSLSLTGAVDGATSVALKATAGGIADTAAGILTTPLLLGSSAGNVVLTQIHTVDAVGTGAASRFDATGKSFSLTTRKALKVNGLIAQTVALIAPSFALSGGLTGTTSLNLTATTGDVTDSGTGAIATALLSGSSAGNVSLTGTNAIDAVGTGAASPFDATGKDFTLNTTKALTVNGVVGAAVALTAPSIAMAGGLTATTSATLKATSGGISDGGTGFLSTPLLLGSSAGNVVLTQSHDVDALGTSAGARFDATGKNFSLNTTKALTVNGLTAQTVALMAPSFVLSGGLTGAASLNLIATAGGITDSGTGAIATALLLGSSAGDVSFTGTNAVDAVGTSAASRFDATGRAFTLNTTKALTVNGIVGATVALTAPSIAIAGDLTATTSATLTAITGGISDSGAGVVATPLLLGGSVGDVVLDQSHVVDVVGTSAASPFAATGKAFTLNTTKALTINGVTAASVALTAPSIAIAGGLTGTISATLKATAGGISDGGTGLLTTPLLLGSAADNVVLTQTHDVDAVGTSAASRFDASGKAFSLTTSKVLTVGGLTAQTATLTAPSFVLSGGLTAATSLNLTASVGGITDSGTGAIASALLLGSSAGDVSLTGANAIDAIGASAASPFDASGKDFTLNTTKALTVNGVTAATVALTAPSIATIGRLTATTSATLKATAGGISDGGTGFLTTPLLLGGSAGTVDLTVGHAVDALGASTASPFDAAGQSFSFATSNALTVNGLKAATIALTAPSFTIAGGMIGTTSVDLVANAAGIVQTGGGFVSTALLTGSAVTLATFDGAGNAIAGLGNFTVAGATFELIGTGPLDISGTVSAQGSVVIATGGAISLLGGSVLGQVGATVDIGTSAGGISQVATAAIVADTLLSSGDVAGTANLMGANQVLGLGNFKVSGDFLFRNTVASTVVGSIGATAGDVLLQNTSAGGIVIGAGGAIAASAGGLASLLTDTLAIATGGTISGGTFEFAPNTPGAAVRIGATGELASLSGIGATATRIGSVRGATTAGSIGILAGGFDAAGRPLELLTSGAIVGTAGPLLNVSILTGTASSADLTNPANSIATIGSFAATGGDFNLVGAGNLAVVGKLSATNIALSGNAIVATGSIGAANVLTLNAGAGGIALNAGHILTAGTLDVSATGGGIAQVATGTIAASLLRSAIGVAGSATLAGTANAIANIGSVVVSGGNFTLVDTGNLTVAGPLSATNIALSSNAIVATGSIGAANVLTLNAGAGGIALNAGHILTAGTLDVSATGGGIAQVATGTIAASLLRSATGVAGSATLAGTANAIANIGSVAVSGGNFTLVDSGNLAVGGPLSATNIALSSNAIVATGSIGAANVLTLNAGAGGIALNAGHILTAGTLDVSATGGGIAQVATGTIVASLLRSATGVAGSATLAGTANTIATVGSFAVSGGDFTLVDIGNLAVAGKLTATNIALSSDAIVATGSIGAVNTLTLNAGAGGVATSAAAILSGTTLGLTALGDIVSSGLVSAGAGGAALTAGGSITQSGGAIQAADGNVGLIAGASIVQNAGTIQTTGAGGTSVALTSKGAAPADSITQAAGAAILANIPNGTASLTSAGTIGLSGVVAAAQSATLTAAGTVSTAGTVSAATLALSGSSLGLGGLLSDGGNGTVNLIATAGTIDQTGVLIAGTLSGNAAGAATLTGAAKISNLIGTLGNFAAASFLLNNNAALTVAGTLAGGTGATIVDAAALTNIGTVTAGVVDLSGASLTNLGAIAATTAGATLAATAGTLSQSGTVSAITSASLTGAAGLAHGGTTTVSGPGGTAALSATAGTLTQSGTVSALAGGVGLSAAAGDIVASGLLAAGSGGASLTAGGSIIQTGGAIQSANGNVGLSAGASIAQIAGTLQTTGFGGTGVSLVSKGSAPGNGISQAAGATIQANAPNGTVLLNAAGAIDLAGVVAASKSATLTAAGTIAAAGTVSAAALALSGSSLGLGGLLSDGGNGTVNLIATAGTIDQFGVLIAGTLSGNAAGAATLTGAAKISNLIGTLGNFAAASFLLNNNAALTVAGTLAGGTGATIVDAAALTNIGTVTAGVVDLSGASLTNLGAIAATTSGATLAATAGTLSQSGTVSAITSASLTGAAGLAHGGTTTVSGPGGTAALSATAGTLTQSGTVSALAGGVGLSAAAGDIVASGLLAAGSGGASLTAGGSIIQTGGAIQSANGNVGLSAGASIAQTAGTLQTTGFGGTGVGLVSKGSAPGNGISQAAGATIQANAPNGTVSLNAAGAIDLAGVVAASKSATLTAAGTVSTAGTVSAATLALSGSSLGLGGLLSDGGNGTVNLIATAGTIDQFGVLIAGALSGNAAGAATLTGASKISNLIGTLGNFAAASFLLNNNAALTVAGTLAGGTGATIVDAAALTNIGTVTAGVVDLSGASLTNLGAIAATTAGATLAATAGTLSQSGTVSAITSASLTGAAGLAHGGTTTVSGPGGTAALSATAGTLTQSGTVSALAGGVGLSAAAGDIVASGLLAAGSGGASLTAGGSIIQTGGAIQSANGNVGLSAGASIAQIAGTLQTTGFGGTGVGLVSKGSAPGNGISQAAGATIQANAPNGTVSLNAAGAIDLAGHVLATGAGGVVAATANGGALTQSGTIVADRSATLAAHAGLTHSGSTSVAATGGSATLIVTTGDLTQSGTIVSAGSIVETATLGNIVSNGLVSAGSGGATLTAGGSIAQNGGTIQAANGNVDLTSALSISQNGGAIQTTGGGSTNVTLTSNGGAGIAQKSGAIVRSNVTGGTVSFTSAGGIDLAGLVQATDALGAISVNANGGALTHSGTIAAGKSASLIARTDLSNSGVISVSSASGLATLTAQTGTLTQSGAVTSGGGVNATAIAGDIVHAGGTTAGVDGAAFVAGAGFNQTSGTIQSTGAISIGAASVGQSGTIIAGTNATIAAGNGGIALTGNALLHARNGGTIDLSATGGGIVATGGTIRAGLLKSSSGARGSVLLDGAANQVAELGNFAVDGGTFNFSDAVSLLISGRVQSDSAIDIRQSAGTMDVAGTLAAGRVVLTNLGGPILFGGALEGLGSSGIDPNLSVTSVEKFPSIGGQGGFFTAIDRIDLLPTAIVAPAAGAPFADLSLVLTGGGKLNFGGDGRAFQAPTASLWVKLFDRSTMAGKLNVRGLHVFYDPAIPDTIALTGGINGLTGSNAASAAFVLPQTRVNYQFNGCPMQSVNCVQITTLTVPVANPTRDVQFGRLQPQSDVQILLPDVADRDYPGDEEQ